MAFLHRFLQANSRLSARFDRRKDAALYARYDDDVAKALSSIPDGGLVADVGGGRTCSFADRLIGIHDIKIVAVDVSADELAANNTAHEARVADVSRHIPFADSEVDLLVSRTLLEHVSDVESAVQEMARVLKPTGQTLHLLPCRYALFAVIARIVPFDLAKRILHTAIPESRGVVEFDVFYDHGHPRDLKRVFSSAGFREVEVECTWDQTAYFHAFFPAFLLVLLYQRLAELCRIRILASYAIVRATR
jgi:ubiquinone/menaquinone biosynthesis C-methylase UbiE